MNKYSIRTISFQEAKELLNKFHYLNKNGRSFRSGINYGLVKDGIIIAVCIYHTISGFHTKKGMLSVNHQDKNVYEMGRLCLNPDYYEKNILSKFIAMTFKDLRYNHRDIDYILSYADSSVHSGKIYQAVSMSYYGMTPKRKDFWYLLDDGTYKKQRRGTVKGVAGEWRDRNRKYRYVKCLKKNYDKYIKWEKHSYKDIPHREQHFNK